METPEQNRPPETNTPPSPPPNRADRRLLRGLQGEDGYDIFDDHRGLDARQRNQIEREDSRW